MDCMYCANDERVSALMLEIIKLEMTTLFLYKEQTYPGRCVLVMNRHVHKLTELSLEEHLKLTTEIWETAKILEDIYRPDKINYLILGDLCQHLHIHLVPKYKIGKDWGQMFQMMPEKPIFLPEKQYEKQILKIRNCYLED